MMLDFDIPDYRVTPKYDYKTEQPEEPMPEPPIPTGNIHECYTCSMKLAKLPKESIAIRDYRYTDANGQERHYFISLCYLCYGFFK